VLYGIRREIRDRLDDPVFIPGVDTIDVAIEGDLAVARECLELVDDLSAHGAQIGRPGFDRNARAFARSRQVEEIPTMW
jgi:hypothetical protein